MAALIDLTTYTDTRGNLTVVERILPFDIKRVFYIYGVDNSQRGGHRHKKTVQAAICLKGHCTIYNTDGTNETYFQLDNPSKCLILNPEDWHTMSNFSSDAILMVFASEYFEKEDYIFDAYPKL